jgi:hypothetical protein
MRQRKDNRTWCLLTEALVPEPIAPLFCLLHVNHLRKVPYLFNLATICLNREYACRHKYHLIAASRPEFDVHSPDQIMDAHNRTILAKLCNNKQIYRSTLGGSSDSLPASAFSYRAKTWCKVAQLHFVIAHAPACDVVAWLDSDALVKPLPHNQPHLALHRLPAVTEWLASPSALSVPHEPPGINLHKRGLGNNLNNTRVNTGFMLAKSRMITNGKIDDILHEWWTAVEKRRGLLGALGEPLHIYRSQWPQEQRVLDDYIMPRFRRPQHAANLVTVLGDDPGAFNTPYGTVVSHFWSKGGDPSRFVPILDAHPLNTCQRKIRSRPASSHHPARHSRQPRAVVTSLEVDCRADIIIETRCADPERNGACPVHPAPNLTECLRLCWSKRSLCGVVVQNRYAQCHLRQGRPREYLPSRFDDPVHRTTSCMWRDAVGSDLVGSLSRSPRFVVHGIPTKER